MASSQRYVRGQEPDPSLINHYAGHRGTISTIKFHPLTTHVITGGTDGYIFKWDISPGGSRRRVLRFDGKSGPVEDIDLSKSGDLMVSAHKDSQVKVWVPTTTGDCLSFKGHTGHVRSVSFNPKNESNIASAGDDKTVKIWNVLCQKTKVKDTRIKSYGFVSSYTGHTNWVRSVRYCKAGVLLCSSSDDGTVRLYDTRVPKVVQTMKCPEGIPTHADFNPCSSGYIGASLNNSGFLMFDTRTLEVIQIYTKLTTSFCSNNAFSFHPSGDFAVCVFEDAAVKILDLVEGRPIFTLYGAKKNLFAVDFNEEGNKFATGGEDRQLLVWEATLIPYETAPSSDVEQNSSTISSIDGSYRGSRRFDLTEGSSSPESQLRDSPASSSTLTSESDKRVTSEYTDHTETETNEATDVEY